MESSESIKIVSFENTEDYSFTTPLYFEYYGERFDENINRWQNMYATIANCIARDYPRIITNYINKSITGHKKRPDITTENSKNRLDEPVMISGGLYIETNISPNAVIRRIKALIKACDIPPKCLKIYYKKKNIKKISNEISPSQDLRSIQEVNPSQDLKGIQEITPSQDLRSVQEITPSQDLRGIQEVNPSQDLRGIQEITPSQDLRSIQEITPSQDLRGIQEVTPLQDLRSIQEVNPSQDLRGIQEVTPSQDLRSIQDFDYSQELNSIQNFDYSQDLNSIQNSILSQDLSPVQEIIPARDSNVIKDNIQSQELNKFKEDIKQEIKPENDYESGTLKKSDDSKQLTSEEITKSTSSQETKVIATISKSNKDNQEQFIPEYFTNNIIKKYSSCFVLVGNVLLNAENIKSTEPFISAFRDAINEKAQTIIMMYKIQEMEELASRKLLEIEARKEQAMIEGYRRYKSSIPDLIKSLQELDIIVENEKKATEILKKDQLKKITIPNQDYTNAINKFSSRIELIMSARGAAAFTIEELESISEESASLVRLILK